MFFKIHYKGHEGNTGNVILYIQICIIPLLLLLLLLLLLFVVGGKK